MASLTGPIILCAYAHRALAALLRKTAGYSSLSFWALLERSTPVADRASLCLPIGEACLSIGVLLFSSSGHERELSARRLAVSREMVDAEYACGLQSPACAGGELQEQSRGKAWTILKGNSRGKEEKKFKKQSARKPKKRPGCKKWVGKFCLLNFKARAKKEKSK